MAKERATIGVDGRPLPVLPPDRDARVWARLVRVMFYTPGFMAILLLKTGEPTGFGISVELLMLASASAVVAGLFIGAESADAGATSASRTGVWSGSLVLELLSVVPFLCALPSLFHELSTSTLLHAPAPGAITISLGASELLPAIAVVPFLLYQLGGFGTLPYVVPKAVNWVLNLTILFLISASYAAVRGGDFHLERRLVGLLVIIMGVTVVYGVRRLRALQAEFDAKAPPREKKEKKEKGED
ncbi:MAG TPA: hypothetical protein VEI06_06685 [Gemmatimonadaceae bacterium]|nr:hypothetical protein [Gemmatimonadaceae bacterium]